MTHDADGKREIDGRMFNAPRKKLHDSKCFDLAEYFYGGHVEEDALNDLAQCIQDAIEDWIGDRERQTEAAWERQQASLMESGGPDDSQYRRDMIEAGRGHLVKP